MVLEDNIITPYYVSSYCYSKYYLGTVFTLSGSLQAIQEQLRIKVLRAYFFLKRSVGLSFILQKALLKLFDALVMPGARA